MFGTEIDVIDIGITAASANYTVDDQDPVSFLLPFTPQYPAQNQIYFETGQLSPGQHKLVVTYWGNVNTTFLNFDYFVQQDAPSSTSSNTPTSTSVASATSSNSLPKATEAIIGGVIGGLVLISLLVALFFHRRRNNRRSQATDVVKPFTSPSSNPNYTSLPLNNTSNNQTLPSQAISSKFAQNGQPSDSTGTLQQQSSLTSPAFISPSTSPDVVHPFPAPLQNNTSNGQTLPYQSISSKFNQRGQPSDSTSTSRIPTLTPLRRQVSLTSPAIISPSSSPDVVIPFTSPSSNPNYTPVPQNNTPNRHTLPYHSKFTQPSDPTSTSGIPTLTPLRQKFSPTSPSFVSPSSNIPPAGLQSNLDGPRTTVPEAEMESSMQRSPSPQEANVRVRFLNEDSDVRIPSAGEQVVELPPFYTLG